MGFSGSGSAFNPDNITLEQTAGGVAQLKDSGITLAKIANGIFTADATGRGKFANDFLALNLIPAGIFTADATGRGKFANDFLALNLIPAAMFTADATGRGKFANDFLALNLFPSAMFTADATGRGKFQNGFLSRALLSAEVTNELNRLLDINAAQDIDIMTLLANASINPFSAQFEKADTFTDSNGYANTLTSATAQYNSTTKAYDSVSTTNFGVANDAYTAIGNTSGTYGRIAQQFTLAAQTQLKRFRVYVISQTGTPSDATLRIETDSGGLPSGTLADANATKTVAQASIVNGALNTFEFAISPTLNAGTYHAVWKTAETEATGNDYRIALDNVGSGGGYESYGGTWSDVATYDVYANMDAGGATNVIIDLGNLNGLSFTGILVKASYTGTAPTFDYRFNNGAYVTSNALDTYISISQTGGAANNNLRFQLAAGASLSKYSVVLV